MKKRVLVALLVFVCSAVVQNIPVSAATRTGERLEPEREARGEYYRYDDDKIIGEGGLYTDKVVFKQYKNYPDIYVAESGSFALANVEDNPRLKRSDSCKSVPTKLFRSGATETDELDEAFFLNIRNAGVIEADWKDGEPEDGKLLWGGKSTPVKTEGAPSGALGSGAVGVVDANISWERVAEAADKVKGIVTYESLGRHAWISGGSDKFNCEFLFYGNAETGGFNRLNGVYDDDRLALGPLAGKIMGRKGMKFDEYAKKGDNRLAYKAYRSTAIDEAILHCSTQEDPALCANDTVDAFRKCYGKGVKYDNFENDTKDDNQNTTNDPLARNSGMKVPPVEAATTIWENEIDEEEFIDCMGQNSNIVPAYFTNEEAAKIFAQTVMDITILPPSLMPREPEKIEEAEVAPSDTRCSLGMMGWILCPVFSFIAQVNDKVFDILKNWLTLAPFQQVGGDNTAAYDVWQKLRNVANAVFILVFIIMIYAQITGRGLPAYGYRTLGPRAIVGVMLVNFSYILCGIAVDISNIAGDSIYRILTGSNLSGAEIGFGTFESVTTTVALGGGAVAGTAALIANLAAFVPMIVMSFIALVTTFIALLFRQVLLILLVSTSAIAFAMYVLPGTAKFLDKWKKLFVTLLMLYPIFSLVFGGSQIAAEIVRDTAAASGDVLLTLFSLGIQIIPLFTIPLVLKFGGGAVSKIATTLTSRSKGLVNKANEFRDIQKVQQRTRALNGRGIPIHRSLVRASERRKAKRTYLASNLSRAKSNLDPNSVAKGVSGPLGKALDSQVADYLGSETAKRKFEELEAGVALIENSDTPVLDDELRDMAFGRGQHSGIDETTQAAAMQKLVNNGDVTDINELLGMANRESGQLTDFQREVLVDAIKRSGAASQAAHLNGANLEDVRSGNIAAGQDGVNQLYANAAAHGLYTASQLSSESPESLAGMKGAIDSGAISANQAQGIRSNFQDAANNTKLRNRMSDGTFQAGGRL